MMPPSLSLVRRPRRGHARSRRSRLAITRARVVGILSLHSLPSSLSRSALECPFSRITTRHFEWDSPVRVDLKGVWRVSSSLCINSVKMESFDNLCVSLNRALAGGRIFLSLSTSSSAHPAAGTNPFVLFRRSIALHVCARSGSVCARVFVRAFGLFSLR